MTTDLRFRVYMQSTTFTFELDRMEEDDPGDEGHIDRAYKFLNEGREGVPVYDEDGHAWRLTPETRIDALVLLAPA